MMRARLADLAQETFPRAQQTPEALGGLQKAEIAKWWPIIKQRVSGRIETGARGRQVLGEVGAIERHFEKEP
jgi:hypothetical protein